MKNLFSLCLVAILSLGSTGFTTVEEMDGNTLNAGGDTQLCSGIAFRTYDGLEIKLVEKSI